MFQVGSHHLTRELALQGHEVLHLSTPISLVHLSRLREPEVRRRFALALRATRLVGRQASYVPLTVLPLSLGPMLVGSAAMRTAIPSVTSQLRRLGFDRADALVVDQPLMAGLQEQVRALVTVYRSTDIVESPAKTAGERSILASVDGLVTTSTFIMDRLSAMRPDVPRLVLGNGVEFEHFEAGHSQTRRSGAIYVGAIDERFDWTSVTAMAEQNPDVGIRLFGPGPTAVPALPANVHLEGPLAYADVPHVLHRARVGLLPFKQNPLNQGRSPMKFYEYLAAGLNVVSSLPLSPEQQVAPGAFVVADDQDAGTSLQMAHAAPVNLAGIELARELDWAERARLLADFLAHVSRHRQPSAAQAGT